MRSIRIKFILRQKIPKQHVTGCDQPREKQNPPHKRGRLTPEPGRRSASLLPGMVDHVSLPAGGLVQSATQCFSFGKSTGQPRREGVHFQDGRAVGSRRGDFNCVQYGFFPNGNTRRGK